MEAKNLNTTEKKKAIKSDLYFESLLQSILIQGQDKGVFIKRNIDLTSEVIQAMLQDWYLKRAKFKSQNVSVDQYLEFVIEFVETYLGTETQKG